MNPGAHREIARDGCVISPLQPCLNRTQAQNIAFSRLVGAGAIGHLALLPHSQNRTANAAVIFPS